MASSKNYLDYIMDTMGAAQVTVRPMMGEYLLYWRGVLVGGIYDDRLLVKPLPAARALMPDAAEELPYEGAKPMLLVDRVDDGAFLRALLSTVAEALPAKKKSK